MGTKHHPQSPERPRVEFVYELRAHCRATEIDRLLNNDYHSFNALCVEKGKKIFLFKQKE